MNDNTTGRNMISVASPGNASINLTMDVTGFCGKRYDE
jgi:hypothetical protein